MTVSQQTTAPRRRLAPAREPVVPRTSNSVDDDEFIRLTVERILRSNDYHAVKEVCGFVEDGVVMLFGKLPSFYMKQIAQTVVMDLNLVTRVENHCEVEYSSHRNGSIRQLA